MSCGAAVVRNSRMPGIAFSWYGFGLVQNQINERSTESCSAYNRIIVYAYTVVLL